MTKFKIGDKVIINVPVVSYEHNGKKGLIVSIDDKDRIAEVKLNDGSEDFTLTFYVDNIKRVEDNNIFAYQNYFIDQTYLLVKELNQKHSIISSFDVKRIRSTVMMVNQDSFLVDLNVTNKLLKLLEAIYSNNDNNWVISEIRDLYHVLKESLENN